MKIEELLERAKELNASDLHITAGVPPKCRVNGELIELEGEPLLSKDTKELLLSIVPKGYGEILEEHGEVDFAYGFPGLGRCRANLFKQRGSYAAAIRLVGTKIPEAKELGIPASVLSLTEKKKGMVLVTGPAGSGKSTTLASLADRINSSRNAHVITLEDPIEYIHSHKKAMVNQREIGLDTQSYAKGLKAALREDPDVVFVGELEDLDTISTAITAAETGHLVFSSLHTMGAAAAVERIVDVFPASQQQQVRVQLASVLEAVISQQLIPAVDKKGRVAAYEVMYATAAVKTLIREGKNHQILAAMQTSRKAGMQSMDDAIYELYLNRRISAESALEFAQDAAALKRKL